MRTVTKYDKKLTDGASTEDTASRQNTTTSGDHPPVLEESIPQLEKKPKIKRNNTLPKVPNNLKHPCLTNDENSKPGEEILETPRSTRDQLSDDGSHASLERGYMCDSESGDDRGSEPECDLFNSKITDSNFIAKKNNPGHSQTCRSPPILPPIHQVQNGTHHPEPSTAVAAVTASASPANTSSTMVVGSTSPREPQIGSPAVIPVSCSSPASPPSGMVPASPPPFLHKGSAKQDSSASNSNNNKLLSNGYEFVSDPSPPSPKLLSPSKFLHKRSAGLGPVPSSAATAKPTINVYDFVSDHSAPSSPDGVIFISSSSKFLHKGSNNKDAPPPTAAAGVSNGHPSAVSPPPVLSSVQHPQNAHNSNKSALDMSLKVVKSEPPSILPPGGGSHSPYPGGSIPYSTSQQQPLKLPPSPHHRAPSSSSAVSQALAARCRSPVASHPNTPTPVPPRDTHSSHSNSSLSSLSQLSTTHKERGDSRSNSSNMAPGGPAALVSASAYASAGSLAGLVFSKPQSWSGNSSTTNTMATTTRCSPAPTRASPALSTGSTSLPLPPTLPPAHHTSPFSSGGSQGAPPPPLLPVGGIFPPGSLTPTGMPMPVESPRLDGAGSSSSSAYRESLFPQHPAEYKKHPDFLRRELDTRFLASQDHSIPIPPPPYMQSEMHQQGPFIAPPPLGAPMVSQQPPPSHLYEKYPKLDSSLYRRPSINSAPKTKSMKPGKWCAMHVRIAWEIYNHQQKQKQAEAHKAGMALVNNPGDRLHPANHLFCSLPPRHDISPFSTGPLLSAASHPRSYDPASHHSTFLNPTPAHLGPFARPGYPGFPGGAPGFSGLGPLGLPGPPLQDPWSRVGGSLPFGSPWGGLKEEAERDRIQQRKREEEQRQKREMERREKEERERREQERREQERREQERRELERQEQERKEQERKEKERREQERRKEMERREMERREQERREAEQRQKERDREIRIHHQLQKNSLVLNGDLRDHHLHHSQLQHHHAAAAAAAHHHAVAQWEHQRARDSMARSPIVKYENPMDRHYAPPQQQQRMEVKIKQERKDDEPQQVQQQSSSSSRRPGEDRIRKREDPVSLVSSSRGLLDHQRVMGLVPPSPAKDPALWGPLTPSPTVSTMDHYARLQGREADMRHFSDHLLSQQRDSASAQAVMDLERMAAYDRAKLLPPPLRTNEYATPPNLPPPPVSASSFFSPPVSPYLGQLCATSGRSKAPPPGMLNGLPPPLIPCTFPVQNHAGFPRTSSPMAHNPYYAAAAKERREVNGSGLPSDYDAHLRL
ncbi:hypothetical protein JTE90_017022 [Oedothorax gibbosus]|uniref:Uncharacterized protein n=1 Tax=Oedothorax gibbosus TaxID=931172 RepID=A0AAV6UP04_9ARAC|nr:hypothetical protein JTE90_017022 [Oedothorax gibbosus]